MPPDKDEKNLKDSDFDFIWKSETSVQEKKPLFTKKQLTIFGIFAALGLFILTLFVLQIQAKSNLDQRNRLVEVAKSQKEISRISSICAEKSSDDENKSRCGEISTKMDESIEETRQLLVARKLELDDETLSSGEDSEVNTQLSDAEDANKFDEAVNQILSTKISDYQRLLIAATDKGNAEEQSALQSRYDEANSMLGLSDGSQNE